MGMALTRKWEDFAVATMFDANRGRDHAGTECGFATTPADFGWAIGLGGRTSRSSVFVCLIFRLCPNPPNPLGFALTWKS